jgi:hypothetical protein
MSFLRDPLNYPPDRSVARGPVVSFAVLTPGPKARTLFRMNLYLGDALGSHDMQRKLHRSKLVRHKVVYSNAEKELTWRKIELKLPGDAAAHRG